MFDEFVKEITKEIELKENRGRARGDDIKVRFEYAVKFLISELWRNSLSYPPRESSVNLRSGYYSELPRYRDEKLTYRQVKAAFEGMIDCRMIEVTTIGFDSKGFGTSSFVMQFRKLLVNITPRQHKLIIYCSSNFETLTISTNNLTQVDKPES